MLETAQRWRSNVGYGYDIAYRLTSEAPDAKSKSLGVRDASLLKRD
jgi:hypothetical protein